MRIRGSSALFVCLSWVSIVTAAFAADANRQGPTFTVLPDTLSLSSDAAYDPAHGLFLVVGGRGPGVLRGAFVTAAGNVLSNSTIGQPYNGVAGPYWASPPTARNRAGS